jgi:Lon-like ATP-dependent protease
MSSPFRQAARAVARHASASQRRAPAPGQTDSFVPFSSATRRGLASDAHVASGARPSHFRDARSRARRRLRGFASAAEGETAGGGVLVTSGHPSSHPQVLVVPLNRRPLMPGVIMPVRVTDERLIAEVEEMKQRGQAYVGAFLRRRGDSAAAAAAGDSDEGSATDDANVNWDPSDDMHDMGTFAQVQSVIRIPDIGEADEDGDKTMPDAGAPGGKKKVEPDEDTGGGATLLLLGHRRLRKTHTVRGDPMVVRVEHLPDKNSHDLKDDDDVLKATANEVVATIKDLLKVNPLAKETLQYFAQRFQDFQDPAKLADLAASMCSADDHALQEILDTVDVRERLSAALVLLKKEVELGKLQADIGRRVEEKISGDQRRYFLTEQLKSIKKELGMERDDKTALAEKFMDKFAPFRDRAPAHAVKTIEEELQKLAGLEPSSSEFNVTRNYLEWLTSVPWGHSSEERLDIAQAREVLDADHYGLDDVKERILEFIAVGQLRGTTQGKIITMVGPPGVGKTSIGQSIARALDRKFFRFSVGGLSDVAEIKGHRRTYVGAMPGKLVQCLKTTGVNNPVVLIDEVDKLGRGFQGDPASALLELLDPEQNGAFLDHYLDVPVDLSKVLFVCTANVLDTIPAPLLDRMEVVRLSGYIADEKRAIARTYLEKVAKERSGIGDGEATVSDGAMDALIEDYCREAGVRNLQKHLEKIYRKVALKLATAKGPEASKKVGDARARFADAEKAADTKKEELRKARLAEDSKAAAKAKASAPGKDNEKKKETSSRVSTLEAELVVAEAALATERDGIQAALASTAARDQVVVTAGDDLVEYVGQPPFQTDRIYDTTPPGVVTGLAWTSMGGSTLYIECTAIHRNRDKEEARDDGENARTLQSQHGGTLKTTGQLGDVMRESSTIAHTFARRFVFEKAAEGSDAQAFFDANALHLHVPAGSTPKDGPSAGCTMVTAMVSLALGKAVRPNLAMTGEVTLTGIVMPIGGVKEKTIAARRSGVTTILFPEGNRKDFAELSDDVKEGLEVHFVRTYDDVYKHALDWEV